MKIVRWLLSPPAAIFFCLTAVGIHEQLGSPGGGPEIAPLLANVVFYASIGLWVLIDAAHRGRSLPYDFGMFVLIAFPIVVPIYVFATRGWRGFATLGWFLLLYVAAVAAATALTWQHSS